MSTTEFVTSFFKTSEELVTETTSLLQTNHYIDFLTQEEITYLILQIRIHTHSDGAPFNKDHTIPAMYMTIMNKLLKLAQYKYMLDPSIVTQLQKTMNLKAILENINAYIRSKLVESANYSEVFTPEEISHLDKLDTYSLGITLRTRLLEHQDYGQQLPIKIRSYLETIDPYIVLAFIDKFLSLSAEDIDIVVQPIYNLFGFLHNGRLHPLYKMVIELFLIGELTNDDKTSKRQTRLDFLLKFIEISEFVKLYYSMYSYLNDIQENQTIALIVSGGNLVTLFAKLLYDIYTKTSVELLIVEHKEILNLFLEKYSDPSKYSDIKALLVELKSQIPLSSIHILQEVQAMVFGDIDLKLIKVTTPNNYEYTDIDKLVRDFKKDANKNNIIRDAQFFLGRLKKIQYKGKLQPEIREILGGYRKQYEEWLKGNCYSVVEQHREVLKGKFDRKILDNIFPSQMQEKYLTELHELESVQTDPNTKIPIANCLKYLSFLSCRKAINELGTRENITKISAGGNTGTFVKAIKYYTTKGNNFIVSNTVKKRLLLSAFATFDNIMRQNSGVLPSLIASLLNEFLSDRKDEEAKQLEESRITYDYSKTTTSEYYEATMKACEAKITLKDRHGYHVVFLGIDKENKTSFSIPKTIKKVRKVQGRDTSKTKSRKGTLASRKLLDLKFIKPVSDEWSIEVDDTIHEFNGIKEAFGDNQFLPENFLLGPPESLLDPHESLLDPHESVLDSDFLRGILGDGILQSSMHKSPTRVIYRPNYEEYPQGDPMSAGKNKTKKSRKPKKSRKSRKARKPKKSRKSRKVNKSKKSRKAKY